MAGDNDPRWREALEAHERLDEARHGASDKAIVLATAALEKRLDAMNEFRLQLTDQARTYIPRKEAEAAHKALEDKYGALASALGTKYDALASRMDRDAGRSSGLNAGWGYLVGAVGLLATVIVIVITLTK